ncbi:MAG: hypothetical protein M1825_004029 [Sarcosagium campestre]|nr:MAG: hypothetical protein M1825_004029 [Sarcosagium campestre]
MAYITVAQSEPEGFLAEFRELLQSPTTAAPLSLVSGSQQSGQPQHCLQHQSVVSPRLSTSRLDTNEQPSQSTTQINNNISLPAANANADGVMSTPSSYGFSPSEGRSSMGELHRVVSGPSSPLATSFTYSHPLPDDPPPYERFDAITNHSRCQSPEPMIRTASTEGSVRLRHPVPGLQSIQGAYVGNVDRLERSAERLSMTSDIGEELRKIRMAERKSLSRGSSVRHTIEEDQPLPPSRQFSFANSIISAKAVARSGGQQLPEEPVNSPRGSMHSSSASRPRRMLSGSRDGRLSHFPDPELESRSLHPFGPSPTSPVSSPPLPPQHAIFPRAHDDNSHALTEEAEVANLPPANTLQPRNRQAAMNDPDAAERPNTSASNDTFHQVRDAFVDFDGVHFDPRDVPSGADKAAENTAGRRISLGRPPLAARPQSYLEPPVGTENMVFYPAPVPRMLNLPKRLSKLPPASHQEKRRTQALGTAPNVARKSTAFLPGVDEAEDAEADHREPGNPADRPGHRSTMDPRASKLNLSALPPQLRASAFFDQPSARQDVQVKEDSAVATLDSILDASATAPVSAFTDHPIVGHAGADVYKKEFRKTGAQNNNSSNATLAVASNARKSRSSLNLLGRKRSVDALDGARMSNASRLSLASRLDLGQKSPGDRSDGAGEGSQPDESTPLRLSSEISPGREFNRETAEGREGILEDEDEDEDGDDGHGSEDEEEEEDEYAGQPTTLLAELQLRKLQQRQRNRTAATAFPNGMHSTLLELDAVAQVQKKTRNQKRVALAWEEPSGHGAGSDAGEDDDVPLGMLFPGNKNNGRQDDDRPVGLLEKREMEDNEPLSKRRERLRGGPIKPRVASPNKQLRSPLQADKPPGGADAIDEEEKEEEETLAQRARRLRIAEQLSPGGDDKRRVSSDFASELLSQFGGEADQQKTKKVEAGAEGVNGDGEETLAQRRQRLRTEREASSRAVSGPGPRASQGASLPLKQRHSMADILHAHPVAATTTRQSAGVARPGTLLNGNYNQASYPTYNQNYNGYMNGGGMFAYPQPQIASPMAYASNLQGYSYGGYNTGVTGMPYAGGMRVGAQPYVNGGGVGGPAAALMAMQNATAADQDPRQRDLIDRWRQSVMP